MNAVPARSNRGGTTEAQRMRAIGTRTALIASARILFTDDGYHATGTNELVARAAVTRGALYHHFADKEDVFEAVFRQVLEELTHQAQAAVAALSGHLWRQVSGSFTTYLRLIASNVEFQRILLIDGPAVLGWRRWRDLQSEYVASSTTSALRLLMKQGLLVKQPPEPLANLIQAALNDAALTIAHASDPQAASIEATNAFIFLLEGLRFRDTPEPSDTMAPLRL